MIDPRRSRTFPRLRLFRRPDLLRRLDLLRGLCIALVCLLSLQPVAAVAGVSAQMAERANLRLLGLLDAVICHGDPAGKTGTGSDATGRLPAQSVSCECCLTGCGMAGAALPPTLRATIAWPLSVAMLAQPSAIDTQHMRSFRDERAHAPRSPPALRS